MNYHPEISGNGVTIYTYGIMSFPFYSLFLYDVWMCLFEDKMIFSSAAARY